MKEGMIGKVPLLFDDSRTQWCAANTKFLFMYGVRNLEMTIRFSLTSRPSERFHRPEMSQIKAEINHRTNVKLNFIKM